MNHYNIHNDFQKYKNFKLPLNPLLLPVINSLLAGIDNKIKPVAGVSKTKKKIQTYQNGMIELSIFEPK